MLSRPPVDHVTPLGLGIPPHLAAVPHRAAQYQEWVDYVRRAVGRGLTKEQAVDSLTDMTDRYPMDVEQDGMAPRVMKMNVANLYDYVTGAGIHGRA